MGVPPRGRNAGNQDPEILKPGMTNFNRRHAFQEKQSDNKLAKFQLNRFRAADLELKTSA